MKAMALLTRLRRAARAALSAASALLVLSACLLALGAEGREVRVTLIHTNDMHGNLLPREMGREKALTGGIARIAGYAEALRKEAAASGGHVILLDAGDIYSGTPEGNLTKGRMSIDMMNEAGYDFACVGNHEFDDGLVNFAELVKAAKFPFIAANLREKGGAKPLSFVKPFVIKDFGGVKVAFLGLLTTETATISGGGSELDFLEESAELRAADAEARKQGAAFSIAITHVGLDRDKELTDQVPQIPLFIGGHSHSYMEKPWVNFRTGGKVLQAGSNASHVGRIDLVIDAGKGSLVSLEARLVMLTAETAPDHPGVKEKLDGASAEIRAAMDRVVGRLGMKLDRGGRRYSGKSSPLGNLIADVFRETAGAEAAFTNRTGIRDIVAEGDATMRDIYRVCPFGNTICSLDLTGREILQLLEYSVKEGNRYLLEVSGLDFVYDDSAAVGSRVGKVRIGGVELDPEKTYRVATSNFIADGGDGHDTFKKGRNRKDTGVLDRDALAKAIAGKTPFVVDFENRIRTVKD